MQSLHFQFNESTFQQIFPSLDCAETQIYRIFHKKTAATEL